MVILFLTGSLEPGKDGVGDYTRRLAAACGRLGHECRLIALNDSHLDGPVQTIESVEGVELHTLRLPATLTWARRSELALAFRAQHPPEWTSLQFVSYGLDPRGIVTHIARDLEQIMDGCPLQLMFHELWIGVGHSPPLKHRVIGQLQRRAIRKLVRRLQPRVVTTTNPFYRSLLAGLGIAASELPLFGNIPVVPILPRRDPGLSQGLLFGSLYPEWKPEPLLGMWIGASAKTRKRPVLLSVGRLGTVGKAVWKKLQQDYSARVEFITLSEISAQAISGLMQLADFGLASSPWHLLGKSGSVAAMLDHGLPVIVTRDELPSSPSPSPSDIPLLHRCDEALEAKLVTGLPRRPPRDRVNDIARDFIRNLAQAP